MPHAPVHPRRVPRKCPRAPAASTWLLAAARAARAGRPASPGCIQPRMITALCSTAPVADAFVKRQSQGRCARAALCARAHRSGALMGWPREVRQRSGRRLVYRCLWRAPVLRRAPQAMAQPACVLVCLWAEPSVKRAGAQLCRNVPRVCCVPAACVAGECAVWFSVSEGLVQCSCCATVGSGAIKVRMEAWK